MEMLNVKVGVMPGKLEEVVVESGTKVKEIFALANIDIAGYETRLDGVAVDADKPVFNGSLLVAMKRIKGNADVIKVGIMPGKLTEMVIQPGTTAFEAFDMAEIDVTGYELRLDGEKIDGDCAVNGGSLLIGMKRIKGNATLKVGVMPGKLTEIAVLDGTNAKDAFALAEINTSGYELRLDGVVIDEDTDVSRGSLLLAMRKIKGNTWKSDELGMFLDDSPYEYVAPKLVQEVKELGDIVVLDGKYTMPKEDFEKVYFEVDENTKVEGHTCSCGNCTCEEDNKFDVNLIKNTLEDVESAISKLSMVILKLEIVLGNK